MTPKNIKTCTTCSWRVPYQCDCGYVHTNAPVYVCSAVPPQYVEKERAWMSPKVIPGLRACSFYKECEG